MLGGLLDLNRLRTRAAIGGSGAIGRSSGTVQPDAHKREGSTGFACPGTSALLIRSRAKISPELIGLPGWQTKPADFDGEWRLYRGKWHTRARCHGVNFPGH
jgi:hypothetical protein